MTLVVKRLEHAHRNGTWDSLGLNAAYTYEWFLRVQQYVVSHARSVHTHHAVMSLVALIAQEVSRVRGGALADAVEAIAQRKRNTCPRSLQQTVRRLYHVANVVWYEYLRDLPQLLVLPRLPLPATDPTEAVERRIFSAAEVQRLLAAAPRVSCLTDAFVQLMFATGLRIGALARLRWDQVLHPDGCGVREVAVVTEKGNRPRAFLIPPAVRAVLATLLRRKEDGRVFPLSVRQLRNLFYRTCDRAGVNGRHCHPHTARHTLVHNLPRRHARGARGRLRSPPATRSP
jgi:integrase